MTNKSLEVSGWIPNQFHEAAKKYAAKIGLNQLDGDKVYSIQKVAAIQPQKLSFISPRDVFHGKPFLTGYPEGSKMIVQLGIGGKTLYESMHTSQVLAVEPESPGVYYVKTKNSIYLLKEVSNG